MEIKKENIKSILVISLSNIGDAILTTPVISTLYREFPDARIDVMVGPKAQQVFDANSKIRKVIVYNKFSSFKDKGRLISDLRKEQYDLIVDLRNTLFPLLVNTKYRTSILSCRPKDVHYMKDIHLYKLRQLGIDIDGADFSIETRKEDESYAEKLLLLVKNKENLITLAPGARSDVKRWNISGFKEVAKRLVDDFDAYIILIGDENDYSLGDEIVKSLPNETLNLCGKTSLMQLAAILKRTKLLISNDSAPMHLAAALGIPVIAIFGPTDSRKYGPRRNHDYIVKKDLDCLPCEKAQCRFNHECLKEIKPQEVIEKVQEILESINNQ